MTEQRQRFADKYFETLNGKDSAIYAGYSEATAKQQAWELLQEDEVQAYLQVLRAELYKRTGISHEKVLKEVARLSFSDIREYYNEDGTLKPIHELSDDAAAALASIKCDEIFEMVNGKKVFTGYQKEIKPYDKLAALEKLAKHLGLYEKDNDQLRPVTINNITREEIKKIAKDLEDLV